MVTVGPPSRLAWSRGPDGHSAATSGPLPTGDDGTLTISVDGQPLITLDLTGGRVLALPTDGPPRAITLFTPRPVHPAAADARNRDRRHHALCSSPAGSAAMTDHLPDAQPVAAWSTERGRYLVRLDYTATIAHIIDLRTTRHDDDRDRVWDDGATVTAAYGPGVVRHTLAEIVGVDGWTLTPGHEWTTWTDGRDHPIHFVPPASAPENGNPAMAPDPTADTDPQTLQTSPFGVSSLYPMVYDNADPNSPFVALCTTEIGRAATFLDALQITANHRDRRATQQHGPLPFGLTANEVEALVRLAATVAAEDTADGLSPDSSYARALSTLGDPAEVHALAVRARGAIAREA